MSASPEHSRTKKAPSSSAQTAGGASVPASGREALEAALDAAFGHVTRKTEWGWSIRVEYVAANGTKAAWFGKSTTETASYLDELCDFAGAQPRSVGVACRPCREKTYVASFEQEFYEYAITGFAIYIWLPWLFDARGPLHDPRRLAVSARVDPQLLTEDDWRRARKFAQQHMARCLFPPTVAIATGDAVYGFWRLKKPHEGTEAVVAAVQQAQQQMKTFLHASLPVPLEGALPMPLLVRAGKKPRALARLLWAKPRLSYDLDHLLKRCHDFSRSLTEPGAPTGRSGRVRPPVMLEVRTLPEDWTLEDLDLSPALLKLCHPGAATMASVWRKWVPALVRNMAAKRYGFLDAELVLKDPRFGFASLADFNAYTRLGLRGFYREALEFVSDREPPRLPYGIGRIVPLGAVGEDKGAKRYLVEGGSRRRPFSFEVTYETLVSSRGFRTELGRQLGLLPYQVSRRAWEALLEAGMRDARIRRKKPKAAGSTPRPLTDLVEEYASEDSDWPSDWPEGRCGETGSGAPSWPLHRDGQVLFPLKHLRAYLAAHVAGEPPRQKEVTAAVRALGGGVHGTVRLGPGRFARCWFMPYPGRRRGQGRA